ncbi:hypothetical protein Q5P01_007618 [Channa striata]|uniref:Uncharacterized protein n=1 Tax=Channa striata TaxID=64152 RepID=A0AA88N9M7_CHASR|nr:hypothetical protein Q5P01_007618 [Channa striata]
MATLAFYKLLRVQEVDSSLENGRHRSSFVILNSFSHFPQSLPPLHRSMDSSPVLRNQSQNKIHSGLLRMKNEHNKMIGDPKSFKLQLPPHLSKKDAENQDPGSAEMTRKTPVQPGVSRLPVLAKSLRLQTPSDFSESHCRWEEKPLAGKAKKKKPCTRPIPFNLSQPKSLVKNTENQQPLCVSQTQTSSTAVQPGKNICNDGLKTQNINAKPSKHPAVLSNIVSQKGTHKSHGKAAESQIHVSGQSGPSHTFKTLTTSSSPLSSFPNNVVHQNSVPSCSQPALSAKACLANTNLVNVKDPAKNSNATQNPELTTQGSFSKGSTRENFQPDHAALLSVLCNSGPQRVSVKKSRQKAEHATASVKSVQFSPDAAALQSILQNEGVKAAGPFSATPRNSVCPTGRSTSIMTAQRVPVRKNCAEKTRGAMAVAVKDTPLGEWTPQRVRDTRHQPMSAMKWHMSTQPSRVASTPGLRHNKINLEPSPERKVVQRLFDDQEDEQKTNVTDKDPDTQAEQLPTQASFTTAPCDENKETSRANLSKDEEKEYEQRTVGGQPFFQAPQRDSVIFFSTGKKLFRAPRFEKQESSSHQDGAASPEQQKVLVVPEEMSSAVEPSSRIKHSVQSLHRDVTLQKSCALSPALALLRKRLPPLEELRMDEEVATYTSVTIPASPGFVPPRPRCGNPLATILLFEESTTFVPIGFDLSSAPSSPDSSTMQER